MSEQLDPCGLTYDECAALAKTYEVRNQAVISLIVANADRLRAAKGGKLHDQRIEELAREHDNESRNCFAFNHDGYRSIYTFARAIEREVRATPAAAAPQQAVPDAGMFTAAVDAEYPLPDTPHASVTQRAVNNRAAMWRGINAARRIFSAAPVAAIEQPREVQPWENRLRLCPREGDVCAAMQSEIDELRAAQRTQPPADSQHKENP